jgi:hypothetical protein
VASVAVRPPDILIRTAPPLSATSEPPLAEVPKPPVSASNNADDQESGVPAEMTLQEKADADAARSTEAGAEPEPDAKPAKPAKTEAAAKTDAATDADPIDLSDLPPGTPTWAVREISKAREASRTKVAEAAAAIKAATDAAAAAQAELAALRAKAEPAAADTKPGDAVTETSADVRPTRDQFYDPESYDEALTAWAEREGVRKVAAKAAEEARQAQVAANEAEAARVQTEWSGQRASAIERYADYVAVAEGDHAVSMPMAQAIMSLDNGADVAYWLGQNPEESARIAALPSVARQLVEIGRVSARVSAPKPRAARAKPIEPIDRGTAPADTSEREPSMDEWAAKRNPEILNGRKPFFAVSERVAARH